jgi:hypothetical protein
MEKESEDESDEGQKISHSQENDKTYTLKKVKKRKIVSKNSNRLFKVKGKKNL